MFYGFVSLLEGSISHLSTRIPSHNGSEEVQGSIDDVGMEFPQKISHKAQAGKTTKKKREFYAEEHDSPPRKW